jgi:5-methylcytosine-specific restriction protein A
MKASDSDVLDSLRPILRARIMDLVADAGIDVSPWSRRADGSIAENPQKNPHYCYEWAFGGDGEPTALCVWHRLLKMEDGIVSYTDNYRETALLLDRAAEDRFKPAATKSRARDQAKRARRFDLCLQHAYRRSEPVRVITLVGQQKRDLSEPGIDASKVDFRMLDPEPWYVHSYSDSDGVFRMLRSIPVEGMADDRKSAEPEASFVDQFSVPESAERRESTGSGYARSGEVRRSVLLRAAGICEHCAAPGFKTVSGAIYLETHHVIPLSENGPDEDWNVMAICPNDHRRAHYADDCVALRVQLVDHLVKLFPNAKDALSKLLVDSSIARTGA